jgi:hypothetical protein
MMVVIILLFLVHFLWGQSGGNEFSQFLVVLESLYFSFIFEGYITQFFLAHKGSAENFAFVLWGFRYK